jgi:excisionase family DNA binding protein
MSDTDKEKYFYSIADLASRWAVSRWTVHRLAKEGRLKKTRIRGTVRFSAATVMSFERKAG